MTKLDKALDNFDMFYESLAVPVILFDHDAALLKANQAFFALAGILPHELPLYRMCDFCKDLKLYFKSGRFLKIIPEYSPTEFTKKNGSSSPVNLYYTRLDDAGCMLTFIIETGEAAAARKQVQELMIENRAFQEQLSGISPESVLQEKARLACALDEARHLFENVLDSCGDGIFMVGNEGRITMANEAFAEMLGTSRNAVLGKYAYELGPFGGSFAMTTGEQITLDQSYADYQSMQLDKMQVIMADGGGKMKNWEFYGLHRNGMLVPLDLTASLYKDRQGRVLNAIISARDLTASKKAQHAIDEAYRFRSQFYTNITHAFRTPLTLLIGPVEGLIRGEFGKINKEMSDQLGLALRNARHLLKLIDQLLDFGRLESGKRELVYEKRDLNNFLSNVIDSFAFIARKKKIKLSLKHAERLPLVAVDPVRVEKILFNIIGNAFKFTPEGGAIAIDVSAVDCPAPEPSSDSPAGAGGCAYVRIRVADTGIGIPAKELEAIFERFVQAAGAQQKHSGSGIGLAHAKELAELMGGKICVESAPGKGAAFSVFLPVEQSGCEEVPFKSAPDSSRLHVLPEVEQSDILIERDDLLDSVSGTRPIIIIIDDNPDVRRYVAGIIGRDYDFMTAGSGGDALQKMERHRPDLVLCDIMMSEMDGYEFLKRVKQQQRLQHIPFVFLTARADMEMKIEGLDEGADDYIVKPFNSRELLARVRSLLRMRELMGENAAQKKAISSLSQKLEGRFSYGALVGSSPAMRKVYQLLEAIRDSDSTVLITGETGTGKELIANAVHYNSPRKSGAMISVNCGAIPRELMEREFFGHVKGAYTGATETRRGYFQEADGGTLFLDEIGELHRDMQVKLLRVLERGEIIRVGDSVPRKVNVRLIAATNKDLQEEVRKGSFREDLFYRIYVVPLHVAPLRDRMEDVPQLIEHFVMQLCSKLKKELQPLGERDLRRFMSYAYPGNVRELEHLIERFYLLGGSAENLFLTAPAAIQGCSDLPYEELLANSNPLKVVGQKARAKAERDLIIHVLQGCSNNYAEAAQMLGIGLSSLYRKLKENE